MAELTRPSRRTLLAGAVLLGAVGGARDVGAQPRGMPSLEVQIATGRLRGMSEDGVRVFKGVPYGEPPVGDLRFRPPRPARRWSGVRDATAFGPSSLQGTVANLAAPRSPPISEDCLYLNIWAPTSPGLHPVLVFLHGGANNGGSGALSPYNGWAFARDGVVAITINWRLAAAGFLELGEHLPDYKGSGNNGLRDQILALQWVRDNIAAFGGDPRRVTIGGVLGGSRNIMTHLASPVTRGLFQRVIAQSTGGYTYHTMVTAHRIARLAVEAHTGDARDLLTCTPAELLATSIAVRDGFTFNTPWRPIIDGEILTDIPARAYAVGASRDIPLLIGINRDEAPSTLPAGAKEKPFPISLQEVQNISQTEIHYLDRRYQRAFPQMTALDRRLRLVHGDSYLGPVTAAVEARAAAGAPTYVYRYDRSLREGPYAGYTISGNDISYQFETLGRGEVTVTGARVTEADRAFAKVIHTAWVNFIKGGAPTAPGLPPWPLYGAGRQTMLLNDKSRVVADPFGQERAIWRELFP